MLSVATCSDGIRNGNETGIDCGGSTCAPCGTVSCLKCMCSNSMGCCGGCVVFGVRGEVHDLVGTGLVLTYNGTRAGDAESRIFLGLVAYVFCVL